jgi:Raf kinase inhibitor-like YbhB/YbcL family protein
MGFQGGPVKTIVRCTVLSGILSVSSCSQAETAEKEAKPMSSITVESRAFAHRQPIPAVHTCDGADISPPLSWSRGPDAAKSLVIICDDPDAPAGTWVHWVMYDIPPGRDSLEQNIPRNDTIPGLGTQGKNDFKRVGYNGPCPPGGTHRYFFKVYALDILLNLPAGKTKPEVEKAMIGHILAQGELVGTYARKKQAGYR